LGVRGHGGQNFNHVSAVEMGIGGGDVPPCRLVRSTQGQGLSPGALLGPGAPPGPPSPREIWYRGVKMAAVVVAAASPRWRLLLLLTSYPEAGSGDLRRNVIYK
jgi:hypothetical protein